MGLSSPHRLTLARSPRPTDPPADPVETERAIDPIRRPAADPVETGLCGRETAHTYRVEDSKAQYPTLSLSHQPPSSVLGPSSSVRGDAEIILKAATNEEG